MTKQKKMKNLEEVTQDEAYSLACKVEELTQTEGWNILLEDLERNKIKLNKIITYGDPDSQGYKQARILLIALDQLPLLVEQYSVAKESIEKTIAQSADLENTIPNYWDAA